MKPNNRKSELQVYIKPVEKQEGEFLAFYQSEIMQATFFIYFKDNIMGSIALNTFMEMLRMKYESNVNLCLLNEKAKFQSKAMIDIVSQKLLFSQLKKS